MSWVFVCAACLSQLVLSVKRLRASIMSPGGAQNAPQLNSGLPTIPVLLQCLLWNLCGCARCTAKASDEFNASETGVSVLCRFVSSVLSCLPSTLHRLVLSSVYLALSCFLHFACAAHGLQMTLLLPFLRGPCVKILKLLCLRAACVVVLWDAPGTFLCGGLVFSSF